MDVGLFVDRAKPRTNPLSRSIHLFSFIAYIAYSHRSSYPKSRHHQFGAACGKRLLSKKLNSCLIIMPPRKSKKNTQHISHVGPSAQALGAIALTLEQITIVLVELLEG